ncbi:MAG TPA: MarR family transcriptional regulator [Thermoplasmata archaeon]|nr:MarR family transcriptional regulator [Thermoplasmata archaeon]
MVAMAAPERRLEPAASIGALVDALHGVMSSSVQRLHPTLAREGITMGQFWALHAVSSVDASSPSAVARNLRVSPPTACANLDQLESAGLVRRHRSERDRRSVRLSLTARGRKVESRVWAKIADELADAAEAIPAGDLAVALRVFREIEQRLAADGRGSP